MPRNRHQILLVALIVLFVAVTAEAARFHVRASGTRSAGASVPDDWTTANCYASIDAAAAVAAPGDSVLVFPGAHDVASVVSLPSYLGNRDLVADPDLVTVTLAAGAGFTRSAAAPQLRVEGLTIVGGASTRTCPAVVDTTETANVILQGCRLSDLDLDSDSWAGGAALLVAGGGTVELRGSYFARNTAIGRGGAVYLGAGLTAVFEDCVFIANEAHTNQPRGGAIYIGAQAALTQLEMINCELVDNVSGGPGGALSSSAAAVVMTGGRVVGNRSGVDTHWSEGAGFHFRRDYGEHTDPAAIELRNIEFTDNRGDFHPSLVAGDGGAVFTSGVADRVLFLTVEDCEFRGNFNDQGAGVYVARWSEGVVRRCRFVDNDAYHDGGAIMKGGFADPNIGETLEIDTCLFVRNRAGFDTNGEFVGDYALGGAICCRMRPRVVVRHCTFVDNVVGDSSFRFGDAFAHFYETGSWTSEKQCVIQNSVFWGDGGSHVQVYSASGGMAEVSHCAAADGEMAVDVVDPAPVLLVESPFGNLDSGYPLDNGPLIDHALDLGFTVDLEGRIMPTGDGPDIGCYEWYDVTTARDIPVAGVQLSAGPNPFNPRTTLSCDLPASGDVRLVLHDARGRRVRVLWSGALSAGPHRWSWDGLDDRGRDCATGVYLAHLAVDGQARAFRKLTLVR